MAALSEFSLEDANPNVLTHFQIHGILVLIHNVNIFVPVRK